MGLAARDTDVRLEQPGAQQVEPVPATTSPTPGRAGLAEAPCPRHPACTRLAPTAAHFPTVSSPLPPPPQAGNLAEPRASGTGKGCCFPAPLGAQTLGVPHYQQPRSPQKSQRGIRPRRTPKHPQPPWKPLPVLGRRTPRHPGSPQLPLRVLGQSGSLWSQRPVEGPQFPPWTPWRWAAILGGSFHSCQSCLQPWSFPSTPLLGSTELHPSPSPCRQAAPFAGISFNLKQVPGIPALAESTLPPTRPVPRRLLPCLFMEAESPAQGSCLTHIPRSWEAETIQRKHECPTQTQKASSLGPTSSLL